MATNEMTKTGKNEMAAPPAQKEARITNDTAVTEAVDHPRRCRAALPVAGEPEERAAGEAEARG